MSSERFAYLAIDDGAERAAGPAATGVRLAELLGRLSLAFDIANQAPYGSAVRSVVLAVELGKRAGASDDALRNTYWATLLEHLGNASELTQLVGVAPCETKAPSKRPKLVVEARDELRASVDGPEIFDRFLALEPGPAMCADDERIDDVARALANLADRMCPIFIGHSTGVADLAERAAGQLGLGHQETRWLRRAALLHDVGRLGVPNAVWMRPGPLDWAEMERVRLHAYYTERVLAPIALLGPVAEIAAAAHERLDGNGYPRSRLGRSLQLAARVLAVADVAVAMSEARPHRPAHDRADITRELAAEVTAGRLDRSATDAVLACLGVEERVGHRNAGGVSDRELEVCRLIARGKMNKEIAELLGISLRTVQTHVAHVFDKLGVHSRSGVAVWLVESDVLQ